jgi:site-specific DNA-methyltransferase (adenine-specific)
MRTEDICALPVGDIAEENCALFLWATWPKIEEAFKVIEAWGFKYKTLGFIWIKLNKDGKPFFGIGHYTKSNSEPCLLCTRGKVKAASNYVSQVIMSQKGAHSEKPAIVREKIVQLLGDKPRIELFARQRVENWNCWGKEAPLTVGARD